MESTGKCDAGAPAVDFGHGPAAYGMSTTQASMLLENIPTRMSLRQYNAMKSHNDLRNRSAVVL